MTRYELIVAMARVSHLRWNDGTVWDDLYNHQMNNFMADAEFALAAIDAAGCVVVPKEPTLEQMNATRECADCIGDVYRAAVAASPFAPEVKP